MFDSFQQQQQQQQQQQGDEDKHSPMNHGGDDPQHHSHPATTTATTTGLRQEIKDIFRDDLLHTMHDGIEEKGAYIMDMSMARNVGLLPSDAAVAAAAPLDSCSKNHGHEQRGGGGGGYDHYHQETSPLLASLGDESTTTSAAHEDNYHSNSSSLGSRNSGAPSCQMMFPDSAGAVLQILEPIEAPTAAKNQHENETHYHQDEERRDEESREPQQDDDKTHDSPWSSYQHDDNIKTKKKNHEDYPTESSYSCTSSSEFDVFENDHHHDYQRDHDPSSFKNHQDRNKKPGRPPLHAYAILLFAIVCLSMTGPFFNVQEGVNAELKIFWRTSCTNCILLPLALRSIFSGKQENGNGGSGGWPTMDASHWGMVFLAGFSYSMLGVFFVLSLDYTSIGNAMVLNNSQAILLMLGKFLVGEHVSREEAVGALVAFSGAVLCSTDASAAHGATTQEGGAWLSVWGDFLALVSAFGGVGYLVFAQTVRPHLNLYLFMFLNMFQNSLYALAYIVVSGQEYTVDFHPDHGLFGWLSWRWDRLPTDVAAVLLCNFFGVMGYIRMMHYFDKVIISVAGLMEPVVSALLAYGMGVGLLPGWKGWIGNVLVAGGTFFVIYQTSTTTAAAEDDHLEKEQAIASSVIKGEETSDEEQELI